MTREQQVLLATAVGLQSVGDAVPSAEHTELARWLVCLVRERSEDAAAGR